MRLLKTFCWVAVAMLAMMQAAFAQASHYDTPLLIVRFNQDRVYYEQPLYNAVAQALQAKSSVVFNLVSVVPVTSSEPFNRKQDAIAQQNTAAFVDSMVKMGIPQSRIHVQYQQGVGLAANEIQLYVE